MPTRRYAFGIDATLRAPDGEVCPDAVVELCRASLPHVEVVDVPGGHILMWDALDETADAARRFLG